MSKIFYDNGKRWRKIKLAGIISLCVLLSLGVIVIFAIRDSPYDLAQGEDHNRYITNEVEKINAQTRPVTGQGTFLKLAQTENGLEPHREGNIPKRVILTFDDGPDPINTPQILRVLSDQGVSGTFFLLGSSLYKYPDIARQIVSQGSDLGLHTFSHFENPEDQELNRNVFLRELDFSGKLYAHLFGYNNLLFRIPYVGLENTLSYNSLQYLREATNRNLLISVPTVDSRDWSTTDHLDITRMAVDNRLDPNGAAIILLHDGGGNREGTLKAIPEIVKHYRANGYSFTTMSAYAQELGYTVTNELTLREKAIAAISYSVYDVYKKLPKMIDWGFVVGLTLVILHSGIYVTTALWQRFYRSHKKPIMDFGEPHYFVSVLVPMYNEEHSIVQTVASILKSNYSRFEVIVIDDGSTDNSVARLQRFKKYRRFKLLEQPKGGKAAALNFGLMHAKGPIVVFVDADTLVDKNALKNIIKPFDDRRVGLVAGSIVVGNKVNGLTVLQAIEYTVGQHIEKRVMDLFGKVMIAPGAFSAWRLKAVKQAGGFASETQVEDFDLTLSVLKQGYRARYSHEALAYTETPHTLSQLVKQRLRWSFGNLQVYYKHRDLLFNRAYGIFGLLLFPREVLIQLPLLLLTPLVDIFIIINILGGNRSITLTFLVFYLLNQLGVALIAYRIYGRSRPEALLAPLMRFIYTPIIYTLTLVSVFKALRGEFVTWAKITHFGNLRLVEEYVVTDEPKVALEVSPN